MNNKNKEEILDRLAKTVIEYNEDEIDASCKEALDYDIDPNEAILEGLTRGMREVGDLYEREEYGIPEVLLCADVLERGVDILKPYVKSSGESLNCKVFIGTVEGDIHSIGKNIVKIMLNVNGFEVVDLGEDVIANNFIDELSKGGGDIVALSTMMTTTLPNMREIIDSVKNKFPKIKIMIGGASVTKQTADDFGVEGFGKSAIEAVSEAKRLIN